MGGRLLAEGQLPEFIESKDVSDSLESFWLDMSISAGEEDLDNIGCSSKAEDKTFEFPFM